MLASIHPLGERARHNRWGLTVTAHLVGSGVGGVLTFAAAAAAGSLVVPPGAAGWAAVGVAAVAAGLEVRAVAFGRRVPGPRRQVNEDWLNRYRGWVYGAGFGLQLGAVVATIVTSAAAYLALGLVFVRGSLAAGVAAGSLYGVVRALPLVAGRGVDRPEALASLHRRMGRSARPVQRAVAAFVALAAVALVPGAVG